MYVQMYKKKQDWMSQDAIETHRRTELTDNLIHTCT